MKIDSPIIAVSMALSMERPSEPHIMPGCLASTASYILPNSQKLVDDFTNKRELIVHLVAGLYDLVKCLRPDWLDGKEHCLVLDISINDELYDSYNMYATMSKDRCTFQDDD